MKTAASLVSRSQAQLRQGGTTEPALVRYLLIGATFFILGLFLVLPLIIVFHEAFADGVAVYFDALRDDDTISAIKLTLITAAIAVPANLIFGVAASWCISKFEFAGKRLLLTLIDLPFAISPVISGLIFVLLFGLQGWMGPWLDSYHVHIIGSVFGVVLATVFVTFPFVARELIPLMESQGTEEEQAALSLGASGWRCFVKITLPNIKWGLLYGVILCNARAMGEFGAVAVVSGKIRGETETMPLHVESLYNDNQSSAAFAVASLLTLVAVATLIAKSIIEWRTAAVAQPIPEAAASMMVPATPLLSEAGSDI